MGQGHHTLRCITVSRLNMPFIPGQATSARLTIQITTVFSLMNQMHSDLTHESTFKHSFLHFTGSFLISIQYLCSKQAISRSRKVKVKQ